MLTPVPSLGRISAIAGVGLFASSACSLLAPSDDSLLGGELARDGAPEYPDRTLDVPPQVPEDGSPRDAADQFSAEDASVYGADAGGCWSRIRSSGQVWQMTTPGADLAV